MTNFNSVILGCGLGSAETTKRFLSLFVETLHTTSLRMLIDADGLRLLSTIPNWQDKIPKPCVLTPHPGEMNAMTGLSTSEIQKDRVSIAQRYAQEWGHIVLLKGAFAVIAAPDGRVVLEPFATSALAKAGSGDVLSGIVGGLLAQKVEPLEAAIAGAFIHGRAAEIAAQKLGTTISVVASDIVEAIPSAVTSLTSENF
jgi:NAD(P)H-hydrate epimerase